MSKIYFADRYSARVIADSLSPRGQRLTTMEVVYPYSIGHQINTHRALTKSSASSRALSPSARVEKGFFKPKTWRKNVPGMVSREYLAGEEAAEMDGLWEESALRAYETAMNMWESKVHKEQANMVLAPYVWQTSLFSATEWGNFFRQRLPGLSGAMEEISLTAEVMYHELRESTTTKVDYHFVHCPYADSSIEDPNIRVKVSMARCARVSYLNHDGAVDVERDLELYERLATANPPHFAPFEHVALCVALSRHLTRGNFASPFENPDWVQMRHLISGEVELSALDKRKSGLNFFGPLS